MSKVTVIADLFLEDFAKYKSTPGGAELHDDIVIRHFRSLGILDECIRSYDVDSDYLLSKSDNVFFIGNFGVLGSEAKATLYNHCKYVIYEHDYKFLKNRNPIDYPNFVAPKWQLTNINFLRGASKIITLSKLHRKIWEDNVSLDNITNTHCSMWSDWHLDLLSRYAEKPKSKKCAIVGSEQRNAHIKKTQDAIDFCRKSNIEYEIIGSTNYETFLDKLSEFEMLVFMTGHPEPTPRLVMEAKMMNCKVIAQKHLIGVAHEDYFHMNGQELIEEVRNLRENALKNIILPEVTNEI